MEKERKSGDLVQFLEGEKKVLNVGEKNVKIKENFVYFDIKLCKLYVNYVNLYEDREKNFVYFFC